MQVVDLFAGAGGFSTGAALAGVPVIWAANHWPLAVQYHAANHPDAQHLLAFVGYGLPPCDFDADDEPAPAPALEAPAAPALPAGFALVPMRPTRAMNEAMEEEGWQWEDLLAAACAITESDHAAISRDEPSDGEIQESFAAYGAELTEQHLKAVREIVGNALAASPQAPAAPLIDGEGCLSDELRELITGMTVSVDVSTGEHDAGNRLFGEVTEVMEYDGGSDKHKVVLLVQSPEANFKAAPAAPAVDALSQAVRDVLAERRRQIAVKGMTPEHDDEHSDGSMALAAACYALGNFPGKMPYAYAPQNLARFAGWGSGWLKLGDPRRNLEKAGALILAELERRGRIAAQAAAKGEHGNG